VEIRATGSLRACMQIRLDPEVSQTPFMRPPFVCRFTFRLSPGQEDEAGLQLQSFFTLGPKEGIFVTPVLRTEE
jgi:hypothetical protein